MSLLDFREPVSAWSHGAWLLLSLPCTVLLWRRGRGDRAKQLGLLVFGLSLAICYGFSTLYHGARGGRGRIETFALMDYVGIYVLIAGTITPVACTLLSGRGQRATLGLIWLMAATGATLHLALGRLPHAVVTGMYLGMGWAAGFCYFEIAGGLSSRALVPVLAGGLSYSIGAVLNLLRWPALWPGTFGPHELFHLFVMAGSLAHVWFMLAVIAPFTRPAAPTAPIPLRAARP